MAPEKKVQNQVIKYLKDLAEQGYPIYVERRQAGGYSYKKGTPDLYCVANGQHLEIEIKKPNGHLSPLQERYRDMCKELNIAWICIDDVQALKNYLEDFGLFTIC